MYFIYYHIFHSTWILLVTQSSSGSLFNVCQLSAYEKKEYGMLACQTECRSRTVGTTPTPESLFCQIYINESEVLEYECVIVFLNVDIQLCDSFKCSELL